MSLARRRFLLLAAGAAATVLGGCATAPTAGGGQSGGAGPVRLAAEVARRDPGDPDVARAAMAGFGAAFLRQALLAEPAANVVISPYSLFTVLAMARAGARGVTAAQIDVALGLDGTAAQGSTVSAVDAAVSAALDAAAVAGETLTLTTANEVWVDQGFPVHQAYLDALAREYGVAARAADFTGDPEAMRSAINGWVAGRTNGLIPELFPEGAIHRATMLALVNALYLEAPWMVPFSPRQDGVFFLAGGRELTVPMMSGLAGQGLLGPGWTAVTLPYSGGGLAMTVLLPDGGLEPVLADLPGVLATAATARPAEAVFVPTLPVFSVRSSTDAGAVVQAMGISDLFTPEADLAGISDAPLFADALVHQCVVSVDEEGTEAAAATAMRMAGAGAEARELLVVDRPFLFWIAETGTQAPLFLGVVGDPSLAG